MASDSPPLPHSQRRRGFRPTGQLFSVTLTYRMVPLQVFVLAFLLSQASRPEDVAGFGIALVFCTRLFVQVRHWYHNAKHAVATGQPALQEPGGFVWVVLVTLTLVDIGAGVMFIRLISSS